MKKLLTRLALLMILCAELALPVFADAVTDSISVCIGYFGWSEDEYVEKAKFSWQELDDWYGGALDTHEEYYSYCNGSGRTYLAFARGFYIRDLLDYAGVDVNSIASIDFFTKDHSVGAYRSFTKYALLDQPRRGVGPRERDIDLPFGNRRRVLDIEHRKHRDADNRQRRHDQQHRKGRNSAARGGYVPRGIHRRGL